MPTAATVSTPGANNAGSLREPGALLLVSCYELGRRPLGLTGPFAALRQAGYDPACLDLAVEPLDPECVRRAAVIAVSVPMHTALRLGVEAARRIRELNPGCHLCFYGLYAGLNAAYLREHVADSVLAGEPETALPRLLDALADAGGNGANGHPATISSHPERSEGSRRVPSPRLPVSGGEPDSEILHSVQDDLRGQAPNTQHRTPNTVPTPNAQRPTPNIEAPNARTPERLNALPSLDRYARLDWNGELRLAGYVESTRGCKHLCTHCPLPPVYKGRFTVIPREDVREQIRAQVAEGARHVTFADPDFLNGPGHALRLARELHAEFPSLTFDFTAKIEHLLQQQRHLPELRALGCLFIVSAVESLSDLVLDHLRKGHTAADVRTAVRQTREAGITLRPSLVPFTPWATLHDYLALFDWIEDDRLAGCVDPVQLSIRLLVPPGSLLAKSPAMQPYLGELHQAGFSYGWSHPDPRMDHLHAAVSARVADAARTEEEPGVTLQALRGMAEAAAGRRPPNTEHRTPNTEYRTPNARTPERLNAQPPTPNAQHPTPPRLTESWFC